MSRPIPRQWVVVKGLDGVLTIVYDPLFREESGQRFAFGEQALTHIREEEARAQEELRVAKKRQKTLFG